MDATEIADAPACARHPARQTGVRCQRCLEPICTECMIPAAVGFQCRSCVSTAAKKVRHPFVPVERTTPYLTYMLICANAVVALMGLATSAWVEGELGPVGVHGGLLGGAIEVNRNDVEVIGVDAGEWYRVFTSAFIHAGPIHLGFNMLILWQVGMLLEPILGRVRFALLYVAAVLGGAFGALLLEPNTITIGASGGVFGLMGALFVVERSGLLGAQRTAVGFLIGMNLVLTFAVPGISIGGHVGGLIAGASVGWVFQEFEKRRLSPVMPIFVTSALGSTLFVGSLWAASRWMDSLM